MSYRQTTPHGFERVQKRRLLCLYRPAPFGGCLLLLLLRSSGPAELEVAAAEVGQRGVSTLVWQEPKAPRKGSQKKQVAA